MTGQFNKLQKQFFGVC